MNVFFLAITLTAVGVFTLPNLSLGAASQDMTQPPYDLEDFDSVDRKFDEILPMDNGAIAVQDLLVQQEKESFVELVDTIAAFRFNASNFLADIVKSRDAAEANGEDFVLDQELTHQLIKGSRVILDYRASVWKIINSYRAIVDVERVFGKNIYIDDRPWFPWFHNEKYIFDSTTARGKLLVRELALGVAAGLILYDNYFLMIESYENIGYVRRRLNHGDQSFSIPEDQLEEISEGVRDFSNRSGLRDALEKLDDLVSSKSEAELAQLNISNILAVINASYSAKIFRANLFERSSMMLSDRLKNGFFNNLRDGRIDTTNSLTNGLSSLFGNAVGLVEFRKGLLFDDRNIAQRVRGSLRPLDIILEKTPFRVTDRFIPGHWGHVAIWVGHFDELEESGTWEQVVATEQWKSISPSRQQEIIQLLKSDRPIVEALRSGVELNSLEHFLNVDDFVAIRPNYFMSDQNRAETIARALSHFGKKYDFNFDITTTNKIVCSELAYQTYFGVQWATEKTLGRYSISPDQVAVQAEDGVPFSVIQLWHNGKIVDGTQTEIDYGFSSLLIDSTIQ